jgi:hypothetical protein
VDEAAVLVCAVVELPNRRQAEMCEVVPKLFDILPAQYLHFERIGTVSHGGSNCTSIGRMEGERKVEWTGSCCPSCYELRTRVPPLVNKERTVAKMECHFAERGPLGGVLCPASYVRRLIRRNSLRR